MLIPLTAAQMAMAHELVYEPGGTGNVMCTSTMTYSQASVTEVMNAWHVVCKRMPLLLSRIAMRENGFFLETAVARVLTDVKAVPDVRAEDVREDLVHIASRPFFLDGEALIRFHARLDGRRLIVAIPAQHVISDAQTSMVVVQAFFSELRGLEEGGDAERLVEGAPVAQFVAQESAYLQSAAVEKDRAFWRRQLEGFSTDPMPQLQALTEAGRPQNPLEPWVRFEVEGPARHAIDEIARRSGSSSAVIFLTAYMRTLSKIASTTDVAVVLPVMRRSKRFRDSVGNFSQSTIVRAQLSRHFLEDLGHVDTQFRGALRHGRLPVQEMVKGAEFPEGVARTSFLFEPPSLSFGSAFVIGENIDLVLSGYRMLPYPLLGQVGQFPFRLQVGSMAERYLGAVHIDPERLDLSVGSAIAQGVLDELAEVAQMRDGLVLCEGNRARSGWQHPARVGAVDLLEQDASQAQESVLDRLWRIVLTRPQTIAVSDSDSSLTYGELWNRSSQLSEALSHTDHRPVAIYAPKGVAAVVGVVGTLLAGRAFVVIDPGYPEARRKVMLRADLSAVVGDKEALAELSHDVEAPLVVLPTDGCDRAGPPVAPPELPGPAYVVFTSGSTGKPKGVMVDHIALAASTRARDEVYERPPERFLHLSSLSFDSAYAGLFWTLVHGGEVVLVDMSTRPSIGDLATIIAERAITHLLAIPSLYLAMLENADTQALASLRQVVVAGEACQPRVRDAHRAALPNVSLTNEYGPSEATVWCSFDHLTDGEITIGKAIPGTKLMVLDDRGDPTDLGGVGELCVSGNLALGYLGRGRETAQSFVPDPRSVLGERIYKTGDLVRRRPDGRLDFLRRVDGQLKVSGFRIEPEEVEAAVHRLTGLDSIATRATEGDVVRLALLVEAGDSFDPDALCRGLANFITVGIAARDVHPVTRLPRGSTGKLDRAAAENDLAGEGSTGVAANTETTALAEVPDSSQSSSDVRKAEGGTSQESPLSLLLDAVFRSVGRPCVSTESYLHQGGDSIGAMRVTAFLRAKGARVEPQALLSTNPLSVVATQIEWEEAEAVPRAIRSGEASDGVPGVIELSRQQRAMLLQSSLAPEGGVYIEQLVLDLAGDIDRSLLASAWREAFTQHPMLRAAVAEGGTSLTKVNFAAADDIPVQIGIEGVATADEWKRWLKQDRAAGFSINKSPLSRVAIGDGPSGTRCVWTHHHAICDGWSLPVVLESLADAYSGCGEPAQSSLPVWPVDQEQEEETARSTVRNTGAGQIVAHLAEPYVDKPIPELCTTEIHLPTGTLENAQRIGVTLGAFVNIAWSATLAAVLGRRHVRHGLVVSGREGIDNDLQRAVGLFIRTIPIEGTWSTGMPLIESIQTLREQVIGSLGGGNARGEDLDSVVVVENYPLDPELIDFGPDVKLVGADLLELTEFPIVLQVRTWPSTVLHLHCDSSRVASAATATFASTLEGILLKLAASGPDDTVEDLLTLMAADTRMGSAIEAVVEPPDVLDRWRQLCSDEPAAVAVEFAGARLTRAALDDRRRLISGRLIAAGAGTGDVVGIDANHDEEPVSALLAVLSVGASWVYIETDTPSLRRTAVIEGSSVRHVISWAAGEILISGSTERPSSLVTMTSMLTAYTIYTSGSTGRPKAVVVSRGAFSRHLAEVSNCFALNPDDVVLVFGSLGFDASLEQLFGSLISGSTAVFRPTAMLDPEELQFFMRERAVSVFNPPTGYWRRFCTDVSPDAAPESLRLVVVGGEALYGWMTAGWSVAGRRLINAYGPTEAVVTSLTHDVGPLELTDAVPIGTSFGSRSAYVLSDELHGVAPCVVGNLWMAGLLSDGYGQNARACADSFLPDPWSDVPGARMYHTGDMAWHDDEGTLTFVGRADRQLKVRGYRLDPAEIEQAAMGMTMVRSARVVRTRLSDGSSSVTCFLVAESATEDQEGLTDLVAERLNQVLPGHLVPRSMVAIDEMPVTASGKVDEAQLLAMLDDVKGTVDTEIYNAGGVDQVLRHIWDRLVGAPVSGRGFISSGGDSLRALEFSAMARRESIRVEGEVLLSDGTLEDITAAAWLAPGRAVSGIQPVSSTNLPPAIGWFRGRVVDALPSRWHMAVAVDLLNQPRVEDLERALGAVVQAHPLLRAALVEKDDSWVFVLESSESGVAKRVSMGDPETTEDALLEDLLSLVDLKRSNPIAVGLLPLPGGASTLLVTAHHFVVDIVSLSVVLDDLRTSLEQLSQGEQPSLEPEYASVHEWVEWLADPKRVEATAHRFELAQRGSNVHEMGETGTECASVDVQIDIPTDVFAPAVRAGSSVEEILQVVTALAVARENDLREVILEVETHGRDLEEGGPDLSRTVGWLTALFPLSLTVQDPGTMMSELRGRRRFIGRTGQGFYSFSRPESEQALKRSARGVDVGVNYAGNIGGSSGWGGTVRSVGQGRLRTPELRRPVETAVDAWSVEGILRVSVQHKSVVAALRTVRAMRSAFDEVGGITEIPVIRGAVPWDLRDNNLSTILKETGPLEALAPLAPGQEGMFLRTLADGLSGAYVEQVTLSVPPSADPGALAESLRFLGNYYPILRGSVRLDGMGESILVVPRDSEIPVESIHVSTALSPEQMQGLQQHEIATVATAEGKVLFRALVVTGPQPMVIITFHHLCLDGWTVTKLLDLLGALVRSQGKTERQPDLRMLDYMVSSRAAEDYLSSHKHQKAEAATTLPPTLHPDAVPAPSAGNVDLVDRVDGPVIQGLRRVAARNGVTLGSLLHLAWALVLAPGALSTVRFGSIQQHRPDGHQDAPGMYSIAVTVTVRFAHAQLASELATSIHLSLVGSSPGDELSRVDRADPYETIIVVDDSRGATGQQQFLGSPTHLLGARERTGLPLTFSAVDRGDFLEIALNHDLSAITHDHAERVRQQLRALIEALASGTDRLDQLLKSARTDVVPAEHHRNHPHDTEELL